MQRDLVFRTEAAHFEYNKRKITRERLVKCLSDHGIPVTSDKLPRSAGEESKMMRKLRAGGTWPNGAGSRSKIRRRWYNSRSRCGQISRATTVTRWLAFEQKSLHTQLKQNPSIVHLEPPTESKCTVS